MVDRVAKDVVRELSATYASAALKIRSDVVSFDLANEPQLAHAYYASLRTVRVGARGRERATRSPQSETRPSSCTGCACPH